MTTTETATTSNTKVVNINGVDVEITPPEGTEVTIKEWAKPLSQEEIDTTRERVSLCRARLLEWAPFFGHLALKLRIIVDKTVPTAAISPDAKMFVNPRFAAKLSDAELSGLICHEVMHPAYMCFERRGDRDLKLWNIAHDYVINWIITEMCGKNTNSGKASDFATVQLPPGGCLSDEYVTRDAHNHPDGYLSAEEIYLKLLEEGGGSGGEGESEGGDEDGENEAIGSDLRPDLADDKNPSAIEKKRREDFWKVAVVEAAQVNAQSKNRGNMPGNLLKMINDIVEPKVDWPVVLGRWVGENGKRSDYTYRRPSRRSASAGAILPSLKKHGVADVVVLWDTSGSMTGRETEILGEVIGICNDLNMTLRVVCCDYGVSSDTDGVESFEDIKDQVKGGGGSDFSPAFELFNEEGWDGVVVAFTDGMIGVPAECPESIRGVLWVMNEGEQPPTRAWGDTLFIGPDGKVTTGSN